MANVDSWTVLDSKAERWDMISFGYCKFANNIYSQNY